MRGPPGGQTVGCDGAWHKSLFCKRTKEKEILAMLKVLAICSVEKPCACNRP